MPTPIEAYTTKDVAELLGIKSRTVIDYIGAGLIKAVPWVGRTWLIQPKEIERLKKTGIDTKGLHAKLSAKRSKHDIDLYLPPITDTSNNVAKTTVKELVFSKLDAMPPIAARLSVEDTRFKTAWKTRATQVCTTKGSGTAIYHGKTFTPNEVRFVEWLQAWVKCGGKSKGEPLAVIDGTSEQWHRRCGGILSVPEIKNILLFLRAKKFLVCDGCNTTYIVRNLDEFFTCAPIEGSVLPKSYKYV